MSDRYIEELEDTIRDLRRHIQRHDTNAPTDLWDTNAWTRYIPSWAEVKTTIQHHSTFPTSKLETTLEPIDTDTAILMKLLQEGASFASSIHLDQQAFCLELVGVELTDTEYARILELITAKDPA
jgi:hypothetical protein